MHRAHVFVEGKVQGVYFRDTTRREAQKRGVDGWVRNLSDGRVEAVFQGPRADVDAMIGFVHKGPPRARVDDVQVERSEDPDHALQGQGFEVRPTK